MIEIRDRLTAKPVYLDHAATSPLRPVSRDTLAAHADLVGNPAALHGAGRAARALLEDAREELAALLGARPDEVIFTSGGSEADAAAVSGSATRWAADRPGIVISGFEHPAVQSAQALLGPRVQQIGLDEGGHVIIDDAIRLLAGHPAGLVGLASVMLVNNEVGTVQPVADIAEVTHRAGGWFHTDAVQAFGHYPVNFAELDADLLSVSAHKIGGPVGIGALLVRRGLSLPPYGLGGKQEGGIRSGTQPTVLAVGFAAAARQTVDGRSQESERLAGLKAQIVAAAQQIPGARLNGTGPASPAIINIGFAGASADDVTFLLDQQQIWCSTGSACRAGVHGPSEVLLAMGRDDRAAREGVRISLGWTTTQADVDRLIAELPAAVAGARRVPR